jgi:hypothetical protein
MNPGFHFVLAMDVIVCTAGGVGNVLRTSVYTSPIVVEAEVLMALFKERSYPYA